ncbi:hypothetical protein BEL04_01650 [Mucilaginibacter sp. PPCGB 2223]|uniref:hypothetical protein n=1 Tax=Mucilaginibacter sp. PPCGB 2223 TaxID=1886027 RepID=UPI0008251666|nr:hypothetical protein [Mucilaginibacter sp. PPCGB 2223]OCX53045.1 hypothetical protein BEL04_01650 [Mucilaginibacter sp. PPCGB 2223]
MKKRSIIFYTAIFLTILATSCVKVIDKFNSNNLTVTFNNQGSLFLTGDKTVNPKDSIKFSYSVVCTQPMSYLTLTKNDTEISRDSVKTGDRMSASGFLKKLVADTIPGQYVYKVVARDNTGIYLGASNPIIVTVTADFNYYTNQRLYVPDTTAMTNKCYYNVASQTAYSFTDINSGGVNSNLIDFGYFWDPTIASGTTPKGNTIYNLAMSPVPSPIAMYNTASFTKNLTQFKVITTPTWANINSGGLLKAQGAAAFKTASANSVSQLAAGSVILFKTAAGKYGAINITYINAASPSKTTYMNFEVKLAN